MASDPSQAHDSPLPARDASLEIERKFLLDQLPSIPQRAVVYLIEQGYLPDPEEARGSTDAIEGRLRRTVGPDGSIAYTHTVKRGEGLVRRENHETITLETFNRHWPRTAGRRLRKRRYAVPDGDLLWEIDEFDALDLVLAEAELPSPSAAVTIPDWLASHVVRDVTEDPAYRNYALAKRIGEKAS
ncbi:MAG: CYTH domain-containing protein [Planctomycetota bacterium]|jgi:CYTH domain-containing protein